MQNTLMGYAYDSHLSYLDHLRLADSARRAGAVAGEAADRGARRVEAGIAAAATQVAGRIDASATQITDAVNEVSSEVRAAREVMEWGFSAMLNELAGMNATLQDLLKCARTPSQTWAYEQFEIARENFRKGNYEDCLKRLDYGIGGHQSNLGYPEGWQLHQLKGDIYLQCPKRELIDLPKAEECFLAAAKYADTSYERAMALTAAAVAAYNPGRMELAENYAQQACEADPNLAEAHFQLARIRLNRRNYEGAWQAALQAMTLDHRYAARLPLDSEFERNAEQINPAWEAYGKKLRARLEAAAESAAATMHELAKSREQTNSLRNAPAFAHLDLPKLAEAKARFHEMTELVHTLSPDAKKSLKLLEDKLQENSIFAFLEAEPEVQRANDLANGALAASREAEFTLRKVEQLSHGLPDAVPFFFNAIRSTLREWWLLLLLIPCFGLPFLIFVLVTGWGGFKEAAIKKCIESFDWSEANAPQTTAETDGNILRANEAMRRGEKPAHQDEIDPDSLDGQLVSFLRNGKKIKAIALYRRETGCDLLTGKSYVESLAFEHDIEDIF